MDPTHDIDGIIVGQPAKQLNHAKMMQSRWDPPIYMEGIVVGPKPRPNIGEPSDGLSC